MYTLYGAYGSNMNHAQMAYRCPKAIPIGVARLHDWKLVMRGVADVVPSRGDFVYLGLWWITDKCAKALDIYEGVPYLYERKIVQVMDYDRRIRNAMIYVMTKSKRNLGLALASADYMLSIMDGYDDFGIDDYSHLIQAQMDAKAENSATKGRLYNGAAGRLNYF